MIHHACSQTKAELPMTFSLRVKRFQGGGNYCDILTLCNFFFFFSFQPNQHCDIWWRACDIQVVTEWCDIFCLSPEIWPLVLASRISQRAWRWACHCEAQGSQRGRPSGENRVSGQHVSTFINVSMYLKAQCVRFTGIDFIHIKSIYIQCMCRSTDKYKHSNTDNVSPFFKRVSR